MVQVQFSSSQVWSSFSRLHFKAAILRVRGRIEFFKKSSTFEHLLSNHAISNDYYATRKKTNNGMHIHLHPIIISYGNYLEFAFNKR